MELTALLIPVDAVDYLRYIGRIQAGGLSMSPGLRAEIPLFNSVLN